MKKRFALIMLAAIALAGCQKTELDLPVAESLPFIGTTESFDTETKTTLEDGLVLWKRGDQVSIFAGRTLNERYQVTDESDGQTSAAFNVVSTPGFVSSTSIPNNVAFYPYAASNAIALNSNVYELSTTLPAVQQYAEDSFGTGAFPMTSVTSSTSDYNLKFKNVLGGLKLQLKGDAKIASISITGNADEVLCGAAKVSVEAGGVPSIELTDATATAVTLDCGAGVQLSSSEATSFIIALPPMTMTSGFTVTVKDTDGKKMVIPTERSQTIVRSSLLKMPVVDYMGEEVDPATQPFTITSTGSTTVAFVKEGSPDPIKLEYRAGYGAWASYTIGSVIPLSDGESVQFRAGEDGNESFSKDVSNCYIVSIRGSGTVSAFGNIMSLLDRTMKNTTLRENAFFLLFYGCEKLVDASSLVLPATTLTSNCYWGMFFGCTGLMAAPELPAMTLANACYSNMFSGCTSLTQAPELPAATLAYRCYCFMFSGCTSLSTAPELPASTLAEDCYHCLFNGCTSLSLTPELSATALAKDCYAAMFYGCTGLTTAPELPATTLADWCYANMFNGCTGLTTAPELPATTLADHCYDGMFWDCTSLTQALELPATTLANFCYEQMFYGCSALTQAPELPATTLAAYCYRDMFKGCTSLTQAPELPATKLAYGCYREMFYGCTSLNEVRCYATDNSASDATTSWLANVSSTGIFCADPSTNWSRGASGIPEGWIVKQLDVPSSVGQPTRELCFTAEQAGSTVALNKEGEPYDVPQEYCTDGENWYPYTFGMTITLANVGDKVYFRKMTAGVADGFSKGYDNNTNSFYYYQFAMSGRLAASGSVISLVDRTYQSTTIPNDYCFYSLFFGCTALTQAPELPATTLANSCYSAMFDGCTALTKAPELPAMTLAEWCYHKMFHSCEALTQAPELPATTLASYCYYFMFDGCTALSQAPELPATILASNCYRNMFEGCTSLTQAPELPAIKLAEVCYYCMFWNCTSLTHAPELPAKKLAYNCYLGMFAGCTSLTHAPELPATTLANSCYCSMFGACTALTQAPELPATTLAKDCYGFMFDGCTSLTKAPDLPATTLADLCYSDMFQNCTSLTQAPELPATTLANWCYYGMFSGCTALKEVRCHATDISASNATEKWLYNVSSTGTFYADPSANWSRGASGIPTGWTVKPLSE